MTEPEDIARLFAGHDAKEARIARCVMRLARGVSSPTLDRVERDLGLTPPPTEPDAGEPWMTEV